MTAEVIETSWPTLMDVEFRFKSEPEVPTLISTQQVPVESTILDHVAVPVAFAEASAVMAENVSACEATEPDGSEQVISAKSVVAVPQVAGLEPS